MRATLAEMLASGRVLLADGATGTNYFGMGLESGNAPELWIDAHPDRVQALHQQFVDAGADIILTNTFGANRSRLALHGHEDRAFEWSQRAARLAREVADAADRPIVVAGSVGPTGALFEPLGELTDAIATEMFREQIAGLASGGADVAWIETMSAVEEVRAAAQGAIAVGLAYTATCSFGSGGRTMMGVEPAALVEMFSGLGVAPLAVGANCGVGASDTLVSLLAMTESSPATMFIAKANCGIPQVVGTDIVYSATPEAMGEYAVSAVEAGASIVGGCCGTSPAHLAVMRRALDARVAGDVRARPR